MQTYAHIYIQICRQTIAIELLSQYFEKLVKSSLILFRWIGIISFRQFFRTFFLTASPYNVLCFSIFAIGLRAKIPLRFDFLDICFSVDCLLIFLN